MSDREMLLPCPFCGAVPVMGAATAYAYMHCEECGCDGPQEIVLPPLTNERVNEARAHARRAWNSRSVDNSPSSQLDEDDQKPITLRYTNWHGETAERTILPRRVWFGSTEWHTEPQWFLEAHDVVKSEDRHFALRDCVFS